MVEETTPLRQYCHSTKTFQALGKNDAMFALVPPSVANDAVQAHKMATVADGDFDIKHCFMSRRRKTTLIELVDGGRRCDIIPTQGDGGAWLAAMMPWWRRSARASTGGGAATTGAPRRHAKFARCGRMSSGHVSANHAAKRRDPRR